MKTKRTAAGIMVIVLALLAAAAALVIKVDPFFHYHKPDTSKYYYTLNSERSQNDGIARYFDYTGIITGSSMVENCKTTEADAFFGETFIKVPFSGGNYKETNDILETAIANNDKLKIIIRGLDISKFQIKKDEMRTDLGDYPTYLYNDNPFDDVFYLFNKKVLIDRVGKMILARNKEGFTPGITSFDEYANWMPRYTFGVHSVFPEEIRKTDHTVEQPDLSKTGKRIIIDNVRQNVTAFAEAHPDLEYYYFFTPYSVSWWQSVINAGTFKKYMQAERIVVEEILKTDIRLYAFNNLTDITTDLNHYKDNTHYAEWINSLILRYMKDDKCRLTRDNYEDYLKKEEEFLTTLDYEKCFEEQEDYENDYYAAALLNEEINGVSPLSVTKEMIRETEEKGSITAVIEDITPYKYLVSYGKKLKEEGQPDISVYDGEGKLILQYTLPAEETDDPWHQYLVDIRSAEGRAEIVFPGIFAGPYESAAQETEIPAQAAPSEERSGPEFIFSGITLF